MNKTERAKRCVLIARDVLKLIKARKIKSSIGGYYDAPAKYEAKVMKDYHAKKIKYLPPPKTCDVCAKGALFYAHLIRFNKVKISLASIGYRDEEECVVPLLEYFTQDQLNLIESAFEGYNHEKFLFEGFVANTSRLERLKLIAQNIIDNKGTFVPENLPRVGST